MKIEIISLEKKVQDKYSREDDCEKINTNLYRNVSNLRDLCRNNNLPIHPILGKNEVKILDRIEKELNCKIIRQYFIDGYWVDGYISETNVVIEIDERPKTKEKDIERENYIKNKLNCKFVRIKEYE